MKISKDVKEASPVYVYIRAFGKFKNEHEYEDWRAAQSFEEFEKYMLNVSAKPLSEKVLREDYRKINNAKD